MEEGYNKHHRQVEWPRLGDACVPRRTQRKHRRRGKKCEDAQACRVTMHNVIHVARHSCARRGAS
eukprot:2618171-Pleurochrysis_carterae.AAC.2